MGKLKICLAIDVEGFSMFDLPHPGWGWKGKIKFKINKLVKYFRYDKKGFYKIYDFIVEEKFPVTFFLVGNKFKPISNYKFIEWGYHSYSHKPLTLLDEIEVKKEVKNLFNCVSFNAPIWAIEDKKNPRKIFKMLEKENYKICLYRGRETLNKKIKTPFKIEKPFNKYGLTAVYVSAAFDGKSDRQKIKNIKKDILKNVGKNAVYCLFTHDFNNKNMKNFKELIYFIKRLNKKGKIKIIKLKDLRLK